MRPKLPMLDEPAAGLLPVNVDNLLEIVSALQKQLTAIIVEHILKVVMDMCETVTGLDHGEKIAEVRHSTSKTITRSLKPISARRWMMMRSGPQWPASPVDPNPPPQLNLWKVP